MGEISNGDGCKNDWGHFARGGKERKEREKGDIGKEKEKGVPKVPIVQYFFAFSFSKYISIYFTSFCFSVQIYGFFLGDEGCVGVL